MENLRYFSKITLLIVFIISGLSVSSQNKGISGNGTTLATRSITSTSIGNSNSIAITSNENWAVTSNNDWIAVTPGFGYGNGYITIHTISNLSGDNRSGSVTVRTDRSTQTITVHQSGIGKDYNNFSTYNSYNRGDVFVYKPVIPNNTSYNISLRGINNSSHQITCGNTNIIDCSTKSSCSVAKFINIPYDTYIITVTQNFGSPANYSRSFYGTITINSSCTFVDIDQYLK